MNLPMIFGFTSALIVAGCASDSGHSSAPPEAVALTGGQIPGALSGKRFKSVTWKGNPFSMTFNADGTEIFQESGSAPQKERWEIKGDQVCVSSPSYPEECSEVKALGQDLWFVMPGTQKTRNHFTKD